jgi:hypothetical protein
LSFLRRSGQIRPEACGRAISQDPR